MTRRAEDEPSDDDAEDEARGRDGREPADDQGTVEWSAEELDEALAGASSEEEAEAGKSRASWRTRRRERFR